MQSSPPALGKGGGGGRTGERAAGRETPRSSWQRQDAKPRAIATGCKGQKRGRQEQTHLCPRAFVWRAFAAGRAALRPRGGGLRGGRQGGGVGVGWGEGGAVCGWQCKAECMHARQDHPSANARHDDGAVQQTRRPANEPTNVPARRAHPKIIRILKVERDKLGKGADLVRLLLRLHRQGLGWWWWWGGGWGEGGAVCGWQCKADCMHARQDHPSANARHDDCTVQQTRRPANEPTNVPARRAHPRIIRIERGKLGGGADLVRLLLRLHRQGVGGGPASCCSADAPPPCPPGCRRCCCSFLFMHVVKCMPTVVMRMVMSQAGHCTSSTGALVRHFLRPILHGKGGARGGAVGRRCWVGGLGAGACGCCTTRVATATEWQPAQPSWPTWAHTVHNV